MELSREITLIQQIGKETEYKEDIAAVFDHGMIVAMLTEIMAKRLEMPEDEVSDIAKASMLHDVGKLQLSAYLYGRKEGLLDIDEIKYSRMHPVLSRDLALKSGLYNENILKYIYYHHENEDGTGYPERLSGDDIPMGAKVLHVCDTFVSLVSERPFRRAYTIDNALVIMSLEARNYDIRLFLLLIDIIHSEEFETVNKFIIQANERFLMK
ncbi:MAG: HD domain-containing protein [Lachnospiraceae bacterium]|nr:HD domain-containing protein [Lachnospiraceae bacterium]